jgi:hypothetical protein
MRAVHKRYLKRFLPAMAGYVALIMLYAWRVPRTQGTGLRALLTVLPMLPVVLAAEAFGTSIRDQDELERLLDLQAPAAAALFISCGFLSFGLLLSAGVVSGVPAVRVALLVLPCVFWSYGMAKLVRVPRLRGR